MNNYIYHHGIKGQRWGVRRFQNEDGSLTPRGQKMQKSIDKKAAKKEKKENRTTLQKVGRGALITAGSVAVAGVLVAAGAIALDNFLTKESLEWAGIISKMGPEYLNW